MPKQKAKKQRKNFTLIPFLHNKKTSGQRAADTITKFAGTWTFFFVIIALIIVWIILNIVAIEQQWDPYPYILLNFVISIITALLAPLILMSQKRSSERDHRYMRYDYKLNRKAEEEIRDMQKDLDEIKELIKDKGK